METEKTQEQIVAENLIYYRKAAGLTQLEIAEKFNYSDKSISKWERAEGTPDIFVLKSLADFYGIKIDDFFRQEKQKVTAGKQSKHWFIVALSETLVWLVFATFFVVFVIVIPNAFSWWLLFIYAAVASSILGVIWASIYHRRLYQMITTSLIVWTSIASVYLTILLQSPNPNPFLWLLFLIGVPLQILAVLWYFLRKIKKRK